MTFMELLLPIFDIIEVQVKAFWMVTPANQLVALGLIGLAMIAYSYSYTRSKVVNNDIVYYHHNDIPGRIIKATWLVMLWYSQENYWVALILIPFITIGMQKIIGWYLDRFAS